MMAWLKSPLKPKVTYGAAVKAAFDILVSINNFHRAVFWRAAQCAGREGIGYNFKGGYAHRAVYRLRVIPGGSGANSIALL
jgi:hypothetical protein